MTIFANYLACIKNLNLKGPVCVLSIWPGNGLDEQSQYFIKKSLSRSTLRSRSVQFLEFPKHYDHDDSYYGYLIMNGGGFSYPWPNTGDNKYLVTPRLQLLLGVGGHIGCHRLVLALALDLQVDHLIGTLYKTYRRNKRRIDFFGVFPCSLTIFKSQDKRTKFSSKS